MTGTPGDDRLLLTIEEASALLGLRKSTFYAKLAGEIPILRIGRSSRVTRESVEAYVRRLAASASTK